jgi:aldehyde:ferredoxin oxidoreductase
MSESILFGTSACHACVIACGRVVDLGDGVRRKGPEYETVAGFGANLLYDNLVEITKYGELCDRYGMDTISLSNTIGMVFKLHEMGKVFSDDAIGSSLEWGDPTSIEQLIHQTAQRVGLGFWISQGSRQLGKHFNCEDEAVQVNGLEVPYHDPRGGSGSALVYATSPRGACHNQSDYFIVEIGQVITKIGMKSHEPLGGSEKSIDVAIHQNWRSVFNSLVACIFANIPPETLLGLINAACGLEWSLDDVMLSGERGWNLKRVINNRLGLTGINDTLPKALLQPYSDRPDIVGDFVPDLENMIDAYYEARDWDPITGYPTKKKLISLGLGWVVEDIW